MRLSELLLKFRQSGIGIVGTWELSPRKGITLGDPLRCFPRYTGPQVPIDCTDDEDPELPTEQVKALHRKFGIEEN